MFEPRWGTNRCCLSLVYLLRLGYSFRLPLFLAALLLNVSLPGKWGMVSASSVSSAPHTPALIELSGDVDIFEDVVDSSSSSSSPEVEAAAHAQRRYFRYLTADPTNDNFIYVGSIDHVYRLDAAFIPENFVKSVNLSKAVSDTIQDNFVNCLARGKDPSFSCRNHVRAVIRTTDNRLFVCTTGVDSPIVYYLSYSSLDVLSVDHKGGRAKCPYDPASNYTIVYVAQGNPGNVPSIYTGTVTDFSNSDAVIFRPPLVVPSDSSDQQSSREYRLLRTEQDSRWLSEPHFVGSFDVGEFVYFFFREHAVEQANCGKVVFSRVARVCKKDEGGTSLSMDYRWTTFIKARLNCSIPGVDMPYYFNEIYDVQFNRTEQTFYGLFRTIQGGFWGSAVCAFTLSSIEEVFNKSPFKGQQNFESGWFPVPDKDTPNPRPGQCNHSSIELSTGALTFIRSHPLLHNTVDSLHGRPMYFTKEDHAFTRLAVHSVTARFRVFYLASGRGVVHKVVQWVDSSGRLQYNTVAVLKPTRYRGGASSPIHQMIVHTVSSIKTTYLYISTDEAVIQLPLADCYRYSRCQQCARDPYCAWDVQHSVCKPHQSGMRVDKPRGLSTHILNNPVTAGATELTAPPLRCISHHQIFCLTVTFLRLFPYHNEHLRHINATERLIQKVTSSSEEVCSKLCSASASKHYVTSREVLQGVPVHFNCTPTCSTSPTSSIPPSSSSSSASPSSSSSSSSAGGVAKVVWHFSDTSSARMLRMDYVEHFLTHDNGLILLDVKKHHHGNFTCSINGHVTARHELKVLPCKYGVDREEMWRSEFAKWCNSYTTYTQEYNQWLCLKKQCLKEKCIPQKIIDKCSITSSASSDKQQSQSRRP